MNYELEIKGGGDEEGAFVSVIISVGQAIYVIDSEESEDAG